MKKSFFAFAVICLIATGSYRILAQNNGAWQYHRCAFEAKDYRPGHKLSLGKRSAGFDVDLTIGPEDWYDPEELGREAKDWLKAAGVSYLSFWRPGTYAKNHLSALVGFRMKPGRRFEVCAYTNDLEGGHKADGIVSAAVGDTVRITYRLEGKTAEYVLIHQEKIIKVTFPGFESAGRQVNVGPWHGGSVPAPVATGISTRFRWVE